MTEEELDDLVTEGTSARARDLDLLPTEDMLRVINEEDRTVAEAVGRVIPALAQAVELAAKRLRDGGRLHYFGAGTSGRLGVLDAVEVPPTFGVPADLVQGHMAGGVEALARSREGVEDDARLGEADVAAAGVAARDVVVVLTASGRTPYCLGVLRAAAARAALTVAVTCNPRTPAHDLARITVAPLVGPEILSGSTRLKAGTAQKLILNMLSTGVMVRLGRTFGNLMVGVAATNEKLRARAARLVARITGCTGDVAGVLGRCDWDVRAACLVILRGFSPDQARRRLDEAGGSLRRALG